MLIFLCCKKRISEEHPNLFFLSPPASFPPCPSPAVSARLLHFYSSFCAQLPIFWPKPWKYRPVSCPWVFPLMARVLFLDTDPGKRSLAQASGEAFSPDTVMPLGLWKSDPKPPLWVSSPRVSVRSPCFATFTQPPCDPCLPLDNPVGVLLMVATITGIPFYKHHL